MSLDEILDTVYPLPAESKQTIKNYISEISYPKGHILFQADKIKMTVYFIKKGLVRAYAYQNDHEVTFWFGKQGDPLFSMKNYVEQQKGYEDIELLEDCEFYELKAADLQRLYHEDIHIANWGRRFAEQELLRTEERLISRQFRTATERYKELLQDNPDLVQRVALGHIASYLGITQVSLSRIRADIR